MAELPTQSPSTDAPSKEPDQAALGHRNLIAFNRALTRWGSRGALEEGDGAVLCAGGTWIPVVANGAFRSDDALDGAELIARADAFFAGLARGFSIKVRDSGEDEDLRRACAAAGMEPFGEPVPRDDPPQPAPRPRAARRRRGARGRRRGRRYATSSRSTPRPTRHTACPPRCSPISSTRRRW